MAKKQEHEQQKQHSNKFNKDFGNSYTKKKKNLKLKKKDASLGMRRKKIYGPLCPGGSVIKNQTASPGDMGSIPGSGRFPGRGNGNSLQYSCLGNSMGRGAWLGYSPWSLKELHTAEGLNTWNVCEH